MKSIILSFLFAWCISALLVPAVRKVAIRCGLLDKPGGRKIHTEPVPRLGGIALYFGGIVGAMPFLTKNPETIGIAVAGTLILLLGLIDDIYDLNAKLKFAVQIIISLILFYSGVKIGFVTDYIAGEGLIGVGLLSCPLTIVWVVGLTNTVNLVDGVDGLAGGIVFIALSTILAIRLVTPSLQDSELVKNVLVLTASIMGAIIGFLKYNVFPASIFMGDGGAYFLGFMTAALSMAGATKGSILFPLIVPLIAFGLPVIDVFFAILRRTFKKVPIFQADKEHIHHRLLNMGFSERDTTRFLWMVSACFGFVAVLASDITHRGIQTFSAICLVVMVSLCISFFTRRINAKK